MPTMRIVPALDELKHRAASFDRRVECAAVEQLTFQRGEETLAQRVVVAITDGTHGRAHAGVATALPEGERGVLTPLIRVVDDPGGVPLPERHPKSVQYELFAQMGFHSPADYAPAPGINDDGQIQRAGPRRDIRNVGYPEAVWLGPR